MPVNPDDFDAVFDKINKKYENDLRQGDQYEHPERISSRSLALDIAMGGGLPMGRVSRFYGPYSSTKSLNGWNMIAEAQEMGMTCCYWNIEKAYDPEFVRDNMGVDIESLLVMEGTTIEEISEKLEAMLGVVHFHVIDSASAAVSQDELEAEANAWRPGIAARAWGKGLKRMNEAMDNVENAVVLLDQVRVNFKTGSEQAAGGKALDHASSMSVSMKKSSWLTKNSNGYLDPKAKQHKADMNDSIQPDGIEIKARVEKSRVCRPLVPATMRLDFETVQFDRIFEYAEAAKAYEVVEVRGGGNFRYPFEPRGGKKQTSIKGIDMLRDIIASDPNLQMEIRKKALAAARKF